MAALLLMIAGIAGVATAHNVPTTPTHEDEKAALELLASVGRTEIRRPTTFSEEVDLAYLIQSAVFNVAPFQKRNLEGKKVSQPLGDRREISDLIHAGTGLCFDRSRSIEMMIRLHGIEARHLSIFSTTEGESSLITLMRRASPSHSISEMKSSRGWMVIDSNYRFIGVSESGEAMDASKLARRPSVEWDERNLERSPKLERSFIYVYGLYSRHGKFYPPYTFFPNVNWRELLYNLSTRRA